jgi:hypothetical protein
MEVIRMRKVLLFFGLVSVLSLGLIASNSYATDTITSGPNNLIGAAVEDSCGKIIGIVNDVMVDSRGEALAIVNYGDYDLYGDGGANTSVPLELLQISEENGGEKVALLKTDMEHLILAPPLYPWDKDNLQVAGIYEYYGIQPSFAAGEEIRQYGIQPSFGAGDEESRYLENLNRNDEMFQR